MNNAGTVSGELQRDSAVHIHVSILLQTPLPSRLPHSTEQSSMCYTILGFPGGSDGKESACNAEDLCSLPGSGRYPGGGHGNPL